MERESVAAITSANLFASSPPLAQFVRKFFNEQVTNAHTRRMYLRATRYFCDWCESQELELISQVHSLHVEAYLHQLLKRFSAATAKQYLSGLNSLFLWLVKQQILSVSPVSGVSGPQYTALKIKTPVVTTRHIRRLLDSIVLISPKDYRDRALIGTVVFCFARLHTVLAMKVRDFFIKDQIAWVRLSGKGESLHELPCHSELQLFLEEYIAAAGISCDVDSPLFRGTVGNTAQLREGVIAIKTAYEMFHRRAGDAGIATSMGAGILRATAISSYLQKGGQLQAAQWIANHKSPSTTIKYRL